LHCRQTQIVSDVSCHRYSIRRVRVERHSSSAGHPLVFGSINARSIANQLNDLHEIRRHLLINVLFVVDTRHDADSALRCLRSDGSQVIDRPRPRLASDVDTLSTNHGGLAAIGTPGICLTQLDLCIQPGSFEMFCVRITSGTTSFKAVLVYQPPAAAITSFFVELSDVLDRVITFANLLFVFGDVNVRLD
jgi:hypothetical protein